MRNKKNISVLEETDNIIKKIIESLEDCLIIINNTKGLPNQSQFDINSGLLRWTENIYVPTTLRREAELLFRHYEVQLLETIILLYKNIFKQKEERFTEFSFRTLHEMSFKDVEILFGKHISENNKLEYKYILTFTDYAWLAYNHQEYMDKLYEIMKDKDNYVKTNKQLTIDSTYESIKNKDYEQFIDNLKELRKLIGMLKGSYHDKIRSIEPSKYDYLEKLVFSHLSHKIHGNIYQVKNVFENSKERHRLRVTSALILSGINVLENVSVETKSEKINNNILKIKKLNDKIAPKYKQILKT